MNFEMDRLLSWITPAALLFAAWSGSATAQDCGAPGSPCQTESGVYNAVLPDDASDSVRLPAFLHLHGLGGSGDKVVGNKRFARAITGQGYMLIAPTGLRWAGGGPTDWSVRDGSPAERDEEAFILEVIADAERRFDLDRKRIILSGFSRGGSMVWDLACHAPQHFAAFAPGGGGFWRPLPRQCKSPVRLFHVHGWKDRVVPLEGRKIPEKPIHQGNLFAGIQIFGAANGCALERPLEAEIADPLWIKTFVDCTEGSSLKFAVHPGEHQLPKGWAATIAAWFEGVASTD